MGWKGWFLAGISGALLAASFEPAGCWYLGWIALVPLWWAALRCADAKEAADLGGFAGLVFYGVSLHWLVKVFGPAAAAFWCVFALGLALHAALLKSLQGRLGNGIGADLAWAVLAGVLWTGIEYFRSEVWWLDCSWMALGYTQVPSLPALQSVSVWGLYGLSGVMAAANAAWVLFLRGRRIPGELMIGVMAMTFFLGERRVLERPVDRGEELSVALMQDESYSIQRLAALSLGPGARDADLLVWPEYSFAVQPGQEKRYRELLARELEGSRSVAVVGAAVFPEEKGDRMENFSWVLAPGGRLLGRYDKLHPIPYVERSLPPNPDPRPVRTPLGLLGLQICYDLDFSDGVRSLVRQGARLLVVTNLDPMEWGPVEHAQHSAMSAARAVESGLWIARAASSGVSQIIDPLGRVRASLRAGETGVLLGTVRLAEPGTPYSTWGWLIAPLCLGITAMVILLQGMIFLAQSLRVRPPRISQVLRPRRIPA